MECPACELDELTWNSNYATSIPPIGNSVPIPKMVLGCENCSETIETMDLEEVAKMLNLINWP